MCMNGDRLWMRFTVVNKYNATRSIYDGYLWDSSLELDFYKRLQIATTYDKDSDVKVVVKPTIIIKPECKVFGARKWKCDFRLVSGRKYINVEVKGLLTRDFVIMFELFEYANPIQFEKTYIASENEDVRKKYAKLGSRFIWLPDRDGSFVNPNNW